MYSNPSSMSNSNLAPTSGGPMPTAGGLNSDQLPMSPGGAPAGGIQPPANTMRTQTNSYPSSSDVGSAQPGVPQLPIAPSANPGYPH
jgi:hypothetical protein